MSISSTYKRPRKEERIPLTIPVRLQVGTKVQELHTGNVSYRGLFVCTDTPPVLRQLLQVEILLPPTMTVFKSHGMSVYVLQPQQAAGRLPGVGIQFYAQGEPERLKWEKFVQQLREEELEIPVSDSTLTRRKHPRIDARFEVHPKNLSELEVLFTQNLSSGGMFLETDVKMRVGQALALTIFHPISRQPFSIDSVVRRLGRDPNGLGVEFVNLDEERCRRFQHFVEEGLAALDELDKVRVITPVPSDGSSR